MLLVPLLFLSSLVVTDQSNSMKRIYSDRINTMLSLLPPIHKMERAGIRKSFRYHYLNDSMTKSFLFYSLPFINDSLFSNEPKSMSESIDEAISHFNSSKINIDIFTRETFSYEKLMAVLVGSFDAIMNEIETYLRKGNRIEIK